MHHIWFHSESEDQSRETSLMPEYMLPSKLGTKRIRAVKQVTEGTIRRYLRDIKELVTVTLVNRTETRTIKPGFYLLVRVECTYLNKDDQPIKM
jgi:hypothetical protein